MKDFRKYAVRFKIYMMRGMTWAQLPLAAWNFGSNTFLLLSRLQQEHHLPITIKYMFWPVIGAALLGIIIVGAIDFHCHFLRQETLERQLKNPRMDEVLERLARMEKMLEAKT